MSEVEDLNNPRMANLRHCARFVEEARDDLVVARVFL
jgi:hypothetical protein